MFLILKTVAVYFLYFCISIYIIYRCINMFFPIIKLTVIQITTPILGSNAEIFPICACITRVPRRTVCWADSPQDRMCGQKVT